ncbi:hypothetical protein FJT64_024061 [Amphibalanus amphitrite]|uniref:Uncharacterized protein n=1 Tax=Amphibalanus amphitrite TaxID=1232801 RepID=A0A6A4W9G2_AMPAM|nr:hypothetical protein FJT64_024061 [Amphibalanus amphitrite]
MTCVALVYECDIVLVLWDCLSKRGFYIVHTSSVGNRLLKENKFTDINAFKKKSNQTIEAFTTANNGCSAAVIHWMDVVEDHEFQEAIMPSLGKEEPADAPGQTHLSEF